MNIFLSFFYFSTFSLVLLSCSMQKNGYVLNTHGTYILAGIAKDGIVIITDSRTSFVMSDGSIYAYYDNNNKIYQFQDFIVAMAGASCFSDIYINGLLKLFAVAQKSNIPADSFFTKFFDFAKGKFAKLVFANGKSNGKPGISFALCAGVG